MKRLMHTGVIASIVLGSLLPLPVERSDNAPYSLDGLQSSITGKINPADGAELVWVISATDSIKITIASGSFSAQAKPGKYKLIIDAKAPYKDVLLDNLEIKENQALDVGEIMLQQ